MTQVELPVGWQWKSIGEVCRVIPGFAFKSKDWTDTGIPVIKIKNIQADCSVDTSTCDCIPSEIFTEKLNKFVARKGDILIAMTGATAGKVGRLLENESFLINQRVAKLEPETIGKDFFWGVVSGRHYQELFFNLADGAAQPNMSGKQIEGVRIPVPPPQTQGKISLIIRSYDDLIENNTRRIEILEEMARRLYEEWFVQFRFPGHEGVEFKESELGLIPEGWKVSALDGFGEIITGKTPSKNKSEFFGGDVPFIKLPDMHGNTFIIETTEKLSQEGVGSQKTKTIPPGSICVSCIGTAGVVVITSEPSQTNQQINSIVPRSPELREFLFFAATSLKDKINNYGATGATMTNLSRGKFSSLQVVEPKEDLLCGYNKLAAPFFDKILCLQKTNRNLRAQRDLLLPKLISGEIDVSDIPMPT